MHKSAVLLRQKYGCFASRSPMFCVFRTACFHPVQRRLHTLQASVFIKYFLQRIAYFELYFTFVTSIVSASATVIRLHKQECTWGLPHASIRTCTRTHALRNTRFETRAQIAYANRTRESCEHIVHANRERESRACFEGYRRIQLRVTHAPA